MSNRETNLLAADKTLGVLFLAFLIGVGGTWLFQKRHHPVSLVVDQALKNSKETQDSFTASTKDKWNGLPPLSFPGKNPLEDHFKAQDEAMRRVRESLRARGIQMPDN